MLVRSALHRDARKLPLAREVENIIRRQSLANNGVWYDPSDLSTLFQDAAGTIPVTGVEQPVGKILDKSGRGNHATQSTAGYKPALSARANLLTETEFRNGLTDAPVRGGLISADSIDGYSGAIAFGHDGSTPSYAYKVAVVSVNTEYELSVVLEYAEGAPTFGSATGSSSLNDFSLVCNSAPINPLTYFTTPLGGNKYRVSALVTNASNSNSNVGVVKYGTNRASTFKATAYDLRVSNVGAGLPKYQRVNTASDYDTIGFPKYLAFDGLDDFLVTGNIDFSSSDKIAVAAGVRKLSDASLGIVLELSANLGGNNGTFYLTAPNYAGQSSVGAASRGTATSVGVDTASPAPETSVRAFLASITQANFMHRRNGVLRVASSGSQGIGNFGNYPLYIGRRGGWSLPFNGCLYGLAICGGMDDIYKLKKIERYLAQKTRVII